MSFADVEKCDTPKEQSKSAKENQVDEKKTNNDVDIDFRCFKCGLHEKCQYFGRNPPFVTKKVEFSEDSIVMRDTFFIGVYPGLTDEILDFVLDRFREFFRSRGLS